MRILRFKSVEDGGGAAVGDLGSPSDSFVDDKFGEVGDDRALGYLLEYPTAQEIISLEVLLGSGRFFYFDCCWNEIIDADIGIGPR